MALTDKQELMKRVLELHIEHPSYNQFNKMLDSLRPDHSLGHYQYEPQHLFIVGESGVGKSRLVKQYAKSSPSYVRVDTDGTEYDMKPVVYANLPHSFTLVEFYQTIVRALGAPQFAGVRLGDVKRQAFILVEELGVEMLILDETNHILDSRYVKKNVAMEAMKHVCNETNASVVLVGTPDTKQLTRLHFQYFRRFPTVELRRFESCDESFHDLLTLIEEQISPPFYIGLGDPTSGLPEVLYELSQGLLGALIPVLQTAFRNLLQTSELEHLNAEKFINALGTARKTILGDNQEAFLKMLEKSELENADNEDTLAVTTN